MTLCVRVGTFGNWNRKCFECVIHLFSREFVKDIRMDWMVWSTAPHNYESDGRTGVDQAKTMGEVMRPVFIQCLNCGNVDNQAPCEESSEDSR